MACWLKNITKWNEEEKSSGTNPDYTELDEALMDLIQRFDEANSERKMETNEKEIKIKNELAKAKKMRKTSLETFCQTNKRKESDTEIPQKRRQSSFSQGYMSYFSEKSEKELQLQKEELKMKKQELDIARVTVITSTSSPTGSVPLDATAKQCYVGTN